MNETARVTVENHLYLQKEQAYKARDGVIKNNRSKEYIQMWEDMGDLYNKLFEQVKNMKQK